MPLSNGEQIGAIGVGITTILIIGGAIARSATMRGETHNDWQRRVQLASSSLEGQELDLLAKLRDDLDETLPANDGLGLVAPEQADLATFDPSPLSDQISAIAKLHQTRERMDHALDWLRRLGDVFTVLLCCLMATAVLLTLHYSELVSAEWTRVAGLSLGAVSVAGFVVAGAAYILFHRRLANGQIRSNYADPPEGED